VAGAVGTFSPGLLASSAFVVGAVEGMVVIATVLKLANDPIVSDGASFGGVSWFAIKTLTGKRTHSN